MASQIDGLRDVQLLIKKYKSCKAIAHRNSSLMYPSSEKLFHLFLPQNPPSEKLSFPLYSAVDYPTKQFYQLTHHKYQNYKYLKSKFTPTFYKEIIASNHLKKHSLVPKENRLITNAKTSFLPMKNTRSIKKHAFLITDTRIPATRSFQRPLTKPRTGLFNSCRN